MARVSGGQMNLTQNQMTGKGTPERISVGLCHRSAREQRIANAKNMPMPSR